MSKLHPLRLLLILGVGVLLLALLLLALLLGDTLLSFYANLREAPPWLGWSLLSGLGLLTLLTGLVLYRLLRPRRSATQQPKPMPIPSREALESRLEAARETQINTHLAEAELARLDRRREAGQVHVALFGEISSGKSSLIRALLPESGAEVAVTGGTTQQCKEYRWISPAGDQLIVTDMPGLDEPGRKAEAGVREEALRAHVVIYLCEGDLTRSQADELERLLALRKPLILALNKIDRFHAGELEQVRQRLSQRIERLGEAELVAISTGGRQRVVRVLADGSEEETFRQLPPKVEELSRAIQRQIDRDPQTLEQLRDSAVFVLVSQHLDRAMAQHRREAADRLVSNYAKKALVGAVAAMTPGSDILIQGYLASRMVQELAALYEVPVRKLDVDLLLELVQKHVRGHTTLLLAIAGNALKAFPGVGTLSGGVLHAIAYGYLFQALGRGVAASLASRGELHPLQAAKQFKESLGEDFRTSARHYAKMALAEIRRADTRQ